MSRVRCLLTASRVTPRTPEGSQRTVVEDSENLRTYDENGVLFNLKEKNTGRVIHYQDGVISTIANADGSQILFSVTWESDGRYSAVPRAYVTRDGTKYRFDTQGHVNRIMSGDGKFSLNNISWGADGRIKRADYQGSEDNQWGVYENGTYRGPGAVGFEKYRSKVEGALIPTPAQVGELFNLKIIYYDQNKQIAEAQGWDGTSLVMSAGQANKITDAVGRPADFKLSNDGLFLLAGSQLSTDTVPSDLKQAPADIHPKINILTKIPPTTNQKNLSVEYQVGSGAVQTKTIPLTEGQHDYSIVDKDAYGRDIAASFSILLDLNPPDSTHCYF